MEFLKDRLKKEIFPFSVVILSLLMSILFCNSTNAVLTNKLKVLGIDFFLNYKIAIFYFSFTITFLYFFFLSIDVYYKKLCLRRKIYYFGEIYTAMNFLLVTLLGLQFSIIQYLSKRAEDLYTCFFPIGSISFLIFMTIVIRIILKSGSRGFSDIK